MLEVFSGILNHEDQRGRLRNVTDVAGNPILSWRAAVLPYIPADVRPDLNRSWDSLASTEIGRQARKYFAASTSGTKAVLTSIVGLDTFMGESRCLNWVGKSLGKNRQPILLIEHNLLRSEWMAPGDLRIEQLEELSKSGSIARVALGLNADSLYVVFADGEIWNLRSDVPTKHLLNLATWSSAETTDRQKLLDRFKLRAWRLTDVRKRR